MKKIYKKKGIKWLNEYFEVDNYIMLRISKEETRESYDVLIDYDDFERVKQHGYSVKKRNLKNGSIFYSVVFRGNGMSFLHQLIMKEDVEKHDNEVVIDHINKNRFDNRKSNLRVVSQKINVINKSHKGYTYDVKTNKYHTRISFDNNRVFIGSYRTENEANEMYLKCCLLVGLDKISEDVRNRIKENNIVLTDKDFDNKYVKKIIELLQ